MSVFPIHDGCPEIRPHDNPPPPVRDSPAPHRRRPCAAPRHTPPGGSPATGRATAAPPAPPVTSRPGPSPHAEHPPSGTAGRDLRGQRGSRRHQRRYEKAHPPKARLSAKVVGGGSWAVGHRSGGWSAPAPPAGRWRVRTSRRGPFPRLRGGQARRPVTETGRVGARCRCLRLRTDRRERPPAAVRTGRREGRWRWWGASAGCRRPRH